MRKLHENYVNYGVTVDRDGRVNGFAELRLERCVRRTKPVEPPLSVDRESGRQSCRQLGCLMRARAMLRILRIRLMEALLKR